MHKEENKVQQVGVKIELRFRDKTVTLEGNMEVPEEEAAAPSPETTWART